MGLEPTIHRLRDKYISLCYWVKTKLKRDARCGVNTMDPCIKNSFTRRSSAPALVFFSCLILPDSSFKIIDTYSIIENKWYIIYYDVFNSGYQDTHWRNRPLTHLFVKMIMKWFCVYRAPIIWLFRICQQTMIHTLVSSTRTNAD